eukprot:Pompholyxophrys_punicea_v1_NODE_1273_length_826_cov_1.319066.p1 type:complete len:207 gc:universal NODE_1273_length_826_cov_1.319066:678-58(-)
MFWVCLLFWLPTQGVDWADVNILAVTDVHGWLSGHKHEPFYDADYGDFFSFIEHMRVEARKNKRDLFIFDSGDNVDGSGLSDITEVSGQYVFPILEMIPFSALTVGNHEIYTEEVPKLMKEGFVDHWRGGYLSSNVAFASGSELGKKYTLLQGEFGVKILVFGFLYDMDDADSSIIVSTVNTAVNEAWFSDSLKVKIKVLIRNKIF